MACLLSTKGCSVASSQWAPPKHPRHHLWAARPPRRTSAGPQFSSRILAAIQRRRRVHLLAVDLRAFNATTGRPRPAASRRCVPSNSATPRASRSGARPRSGSRRGPVAWRPRPGPSCRVGQRFWRPRGARLALSDENRPVAHGAVAFSRFGQHCWDCGPCPGQMAAGRCSPRSQPRTKRIVVLVIERSSGDSATKRRRDLASGLSC